MSIGNRGTVILVLAAALAETAVAHGQDPAPTTRAARKWTIEAVAGGT